MPIYRLDDLGWYEFERLCQALLQAGYGVAVEAWGGSADHGRDAYSEVTLEFPTKGVAQGGPFVFQAKFVQGANAAGAKPGALLKKAIRAEMKRIVARRNNDQWSNPACYALLTNVPFTTSLRREVTNIIKAKMPGVTIALVGEADLSSLLADAPGIRTSFPQLLGLQDLRALLQGAVARDIGVRGDLIMEHAADIAPVFVPTAAYSHALTVLNAHGFVVLTGPPEMGKTSIAEMIALARLSEGWEVFDCADPSDFFRALDRDRAQVFVADDAFGSTEYSPDRGEQWAAHLHKVLRAVDYRHWLLWTSRPAPLRSGLRQLQLQADAEGFPDPAEVQVDASVLTREEKGLILYRHAKDAGLDDRNKCLVRAHAEFIVDNPDFTPERIRRLARSRLAELGKDLSSDEVRTAIADELEQSTDRMAKSFDRLGPEHKRLLIAMLDAGDGVAPLEDVQRAYDRHRPPDGDTALADLIVDLDHHFVRRIE